MWIDQPEHYFKVSLERIKQAKLLHDEGASYAFSMYAAGVAVEWMLRAFKMRRGPSFDEKHDLLGLFKASGMLDFDPKLLKRKAGGEQQIEDHFRMMQVTITSICELWSNDLRFASEDRTLAHLKKKRLHLSVRGDPLKENARRLLVSSQLMINKGAFQWNLLKKSGPS